MCSFVCLKGVRVFKSQYAYELDLPHVVFTSAVVLQHPNECHVSPVLKYFLT